MGPAFSIGNLRKQVELAHSECFYLLVWCVYVCVCLCLCVCEDVCAHRGCFYLLVWFVCVCLCVWYVCVFVRMYVPTGDASTCLCGLCVCVCVCCMCLSVCGMCVRVC